MVLIPSIRIKRLTSSAIIPSYAKRGDAGMDLTAVRKEYDEYGNVCYGTGLSMEIPEGYVGLIFPRSSVSKKEMLLSNAVGVIDSGYRGEIMLKFKRTIEPKIAEVYRNPPAEFGLCIDSEDFAEYEVGDRVGQIIILPYPYISFEEVDELSSSERGDGGYGSTGR